ncbi:hypothetical protein [Paenibacillus durus]|uniref:Uncharacterized protein n=1 Tax=Paenibacillus durus TaxID=44251 RepID=A0A089HNS0_PAEDU|nr:hypothetical protein [Paenibacillus durus]AIQ13646.1 hypothetical protein PDUR_18280 [Paenibacillus durus]
MTMAAKINGEIKAELTRISTQLNYVTARLEAGGRAKESAAYVLLSGAESAMLLMMAGGVSSDSAGSAEDFTEQIMSVFDEALNIVRLGDEIERTAPLYARLGRQLKFRADKVLQEFGAVTGASLLRSEGIMKKRIPKKSGELFKLRVQVSTAAQDEKVRLLQLA